MDKKFQIGEIARFFDMPASTFRYWEDKGILHPRKKIENQYRGIMQLKILMTISDVIFYKNLGLELRKFVEWMPQRLSSMENYFLRNL